MTWLLHGLGAFASVHAVLSELCANLIKYVSTVQINTLQATRSPWTPLDIVCQFLCYVKK